MIIGEFDFTKILKGLLEQKTELNPSYSLRAFARDIGVSPASLSEVMNKKQGLSLQKAKKICWSLNFSEEEEQFFCDLVESQFSRNQDRKLKAKVRLKRYRKPEQKNLDPEMLKIFSDWYHFAILELTNLSSFKKDTSWIAKTLNITEQESEEAIERLFKFNFLKEEDGKWIDANFSLSTGSEVPSEIIRTLHLQLIEKMKESVVYDSVESKDHRAFIFSFKKSRIPEVKDRINAFRESFYNEFAEEGNQDSVYCISTNFFELTKGL